MKSLIKPLVVSLFLAALTLPSIVVAQTSSQALGSISTPARLPSSLGTLEFKDGAPSKETIEATRVGPRQVLVLIGEAV